MSKTTRILSIARLKLEREQERMWSGCRMTESKRAKLGLCCALGHQPRPAYHCGLLITTCMPTQTAQYS